MCKHYFDLRIRDARGNAFTIVELLVSMAVLGLLLTIMLTVTNRAGSAVQHASAKLEAFAGARSAFDVLTQRLSQATLNTYWDYFDAAGVSATTSDPVTFGRASDLDFVVKQNAVSGMKSSGQGVFFQTPDAYSTDANYRSVQGLLNVCGYFVQYGSDDAFRPASETKQRWRFRLMEVVLPAENLLVYKYTDSAWSKQIDGSNPKLSDLFARPLADNVIALIVWPRLSTGSDPAGTKLLVNKSDSGGFSYSYDSRQKSGKVDQLISSNQLPPTVQITMVVIDEASAVRMDAGKTAPSVIKDALNGRFLDAGEDQYQQDLKDMSDSLTSNHINFEILNTTVVLRESAWGK